MTFAVKYTIEAFDKFTRVGKKIGKSMANIGKRAKETSERLKKAGEAMARVGAGMAIGITAPIIGAGVAMIKASDDMEHFKNRLHVTGLATGKLNAAYKKLNDFIISTPFDMKDMQDASVTLLATGASVDTVINKMKIFGDVSALTSMSMNEVASMMAKAQASSRGVNMVFTEMGEKGVLVRKELIKLAAQMGHTITDKQLDKQIQAGYVTYPILIKAIERMRVKGGELHGQMKAMSEEVGPLLGSFKTALIIKVLSPLGTAITDSLHLKETLQGWIDYLVKNQDKITLFIKTHQTLIKMVVSFAAIAAILAPMMLSLGLIVMTIGAILSPITLVIIGIAALAAGVTYLYLKFAWFRDIVKVTWVIIKDLGKVMLFGLNQAIYTLEKIGELFHFVFIDPILLAIKLFKKFTALFSHHKSINAKHNITQTSNATNSMFPTFKQKSQTVNSNVNIGLHDPGGAVKSVSTKSDGHIGFNLGANMLHSRF